MGAGRPTIILPVSQLITTMLQRHLPLILLGCTEHKRNKTENDEIDNKQLKILCSLYTLRGILMGFGVPRSSPASNYTSMSLASHRAQKEEHYDNTDN